MMAKEIQVNRQQINTIKFADEQAILGDRTVTSEVVKRNK